jgi:NTP pyrophosphatase (non-canonical NTP hydrolase)
MTEERGWNAIVGQKAKEAKMGYGCQKEFHLNDFHHANYERQREAFAPPHPLMALVACVQEEVGELAAAVLGVTGEKKRKAHLTNADVLDAVADAMTYLSLVASNVGCMDLEKLLGETFNMVSDRANSKIKVGV